MRWALPVLLISWALSFFGGFIGYYVPPEIPGMPVEMSRILAFVGGQVSAVLIALICLALRWKSTDPWQRGLATIPAIGAGLVVFGFGALYFWTLG